MDSRISRTTHEAHYSTLAPQHTETNFHHHFKFPSKLYIFLLRKIKERIMANDFLTFTLIFLSLSKRNYQICHTAFAKSEGRSKDSLVISQCE